MRISPLPTPPQLSGALDAARPDPTAHGRELTSSVASGDVELREKFNTFVGEAFYGQSCAERLW